MNKILYNSEIKQVNGYFDLVFDTQKLAEDWKPALLELINCQLFTKKRLKDIDAKNMPISQRGGSPIDFVFNATGKLYGTYIEDVPNQTGSLDDKDLAIKDTVIDKLAELQKERIIEEYSFETILINKTAGKIEIIEEYSFETILINKTAGKIEYKLYVKAGKNVISKQFSI